MDASEISSKSVAVVHQSEVCEPSYYHWQGHMVTEGLDMMDDIQVAFETWMEMDTLDSSHYHSHAVPWQASAAIHVVHNKQHKDELTVDVWVRSDKDEASGH